jgi:hypothetical protein
LTPAFVIVCLVYDRWRAVPFEPIKWMASMK